MPAPPTISLRPAFPFRTKLTLLAALLTTVPLTYVGIRVIGKTSASLEAAHRDLRIAVVGDLARTIDERFAVAQDGLDAAGRALTSREIGEEEGLRMAVRLVEASEALDHAAVYDARGALIDTIREPGAREVRVDPTLAEALRRSTREHGVATGRAFATGDDTRVPIVVALRVGDVTSGYVTSAVSLEALQRRLESLGARFFADRPDSLLVVDEELRVLARSSAVEGHALPSTRGKGVFRGLGAGNGLRHLEALSREYVDAGTEMVGSVVALPARGWLVVAQVPRRVAFAAVDDARRVLTTTFAAGVLVALIAAVLVARQITRPLTALTDFARDLAARRFDRRVTVTTRDELAILGETMSQAAEDLEASEKRIRDEVAIRTDLGRYLPAEIVEKVVRREQDMGLGGVRREVTVLFADVVAFTPLTERMSAEQIVTMLNELFSLLTEIVFRHGGTIDKFIGDCVMAMWGAPTASQDHAARAVAAAIDMQRWLEAGNEAWRARWDVSLELAIGINTGEAIVGNVGSASRMEYTAIGDTVNVAAHLESIARPGQILVAASTRQAIGSAVETVDLGERSLAGRRQGVHVFEVRPS